MKYEEEEMQYNDVIKTLKSLQQVKAPPYFMADLRRRINTEDFTEEKKQSIWEKFFLPSRLIPSAGLAAAAILLLFVFNTGGEETENPLLMNPKVREDVVQTTASSNTQGEEYIEEELGRNELRSSQELAAKETVPETTAFGYSTTQPSLSRSSFIINKSGLNFRQINLSDEEREVLNKLKEKIKNMIEKGRN